MQRERKYKFSISLFANGFIGDPEEEEHGASPHRQH
jgi:hypothetical protein